MFSRAYGPRSLAIFPPKPMHKDTSSTHHATLSANACHWIRHHASNPSTNPVKHWQAPNNLIGSGTTLLLQSRDDASNSCRLALLELLEILIQNHLYSLLYIPCICFCNLLFFIFNSMSISVCMYVSINCSHE